MRCVSSILEFLRLTIVVVLLECHVELADVDIYERFPDLSSEHLAEELLVELRFAAPQNYYLHLRALAGIGQ